MPHRPRIGAFVVPRTDGVATVIDALEQRSEREIGILRAAYHVMGREGSNRLNLQAIADEAGISKGLILYHFNTKSAVLQHAMEWALLQTEKRIRNALNGSRGRHMLADVLDAIFISPQANREFQMVYLDLIEASVRDDSFAELPGITRAIVEGLYAEVIQTGVDSGDLAVDDVADAARRMRVVIDGVLLLWLQRSDWKSSHGKVKQECLEMLHRLLSA